MTAIGKIFVIINLLFSLVVVGLILVVYVARTNWSTAAKQWEKEVEVVKASRLATESQMQQVREDAAKEVDSKQKELDRQKADLEKRDGEVKTLTAEIEAVKKGGNKEGISLQAMQEELKKRAEEVGLLEKQVKGKDEQIVGLIKDKNDSNNAKVAAEIKANSYQAKAERLELRVREVETEMVKQKSKGGSGGSAGTAVVSSASAPNPPAQDVEGIVTETSQRGDLIRISLGSDQGLARGQTLDVYRLKPTPLYLGMIRLTDVRATEAVGQPVERLKYPAQKGDQVANDVTPKK